MAIGDQEAMVVEARKNSSLEDIANATPDEIAAQLEQIDKTMTELVHKQQEIASQLEDIEEEALLELFEPDEEDPPIREQ